MILLIDDSDQERAVIRKMLESGGHVVHEAAGGDEGLSLFGTLEPTLVICDLMMPQKDGFATVAEILELEPGASVIAMSGVWFGPSDHAAMARDLGLAAVIEKPFDRAQLLDLVNRTLNPPPKPKKKAKAKAKAKPKARPKPKRKAGAKAKAGARAKSGARAKAGARAKSGASSRKKKRR